MDVATVEKTRDNLVDVLTQPFLLLEETNKYLDAIHDYFKCRCRESGLPEPAKCIVVPPREPGTTWCSQRMVIDGVQITAELLEEMKKSVDARPVLWAAYLDTLPTLQACIDANDHSIFPRLNALALALEDYAARENVLLPDHHMCPSVQGNPPAVFGIQLTKADLQRTPADLLQRLKLRLLRQSEQRRLSEAQVGAMRQEIHEKVVNVVSQQEQRWIAYELKTALIGVGFGLITEEFTIEDRLLPRDEEKLQGRQLLVTSLDLDRNFPDGAMHRELIDRLTESARSLAKQFKRTPLNQLWVHVHTIVTARNIFSLSVTAGVSVYDRRIAPESSQEN